MKTLTQIQAEHYAWAEKNFPDAQLWQQTLGVAEESGELCHAVLKLSQNIRTNENHEEKLDDAIGDIVIYLIHICNIRKKSFHEIIDKTWRQVSARDWAKNKKTGKITE